MTDRLYTTAARISAAGPSLKVTAGNVLTLTPPPTIERDELDRALAIVDECIGEVERSK